MDTLWADFEGSHRFCYNPSWVDVAETFVFAKGVFGVNMRKGIWHRLPAMSVTLITPRHIINIFLSKLHEVEIVPWNNKLAWNRNLSVLMSLFCGILKYLMLLDV